MELNLEAQKADSTIFEGEGGGYYAWTTASNTPAVAIAAGRLVLHPQGFALPHYADTCKIGYVVQGSCTLGLLSADSPAEKVIMVKKGDAIPIPLGTISWWFNAGDSDFTAIFIGESSESYSPGQFNYFLLTGANAILRGFSTNFISKIYSLDDQQSKELVESQSNPLIVKIEGDIHMPNNSNCKKDEYVINLDAMKESCFIDEVGLSPKLTRLEPQGELDPYYSTAHQMMYVTGGGGRIQIVGLNGMRMLDEVVEEGQLIFVPKFFLSALLASHQGLEFFCVSTSPRPMSMPIAGNGSAYKALSSSVLEAALNVSPEFVKTFKSN